MSRRIAPRRRIAAPFLSALVVLAAAGAVAPLVAPLVAQAPLPANAIHGPRWRHIGPFRAGRTKSAVGVAQQPNVFYMAPTNGGVWKTNDYGRTWNPIFDAMASGSIGAVEVAPSDPNVIYVGSGEGLQRPDLSTGDGLYRSNDAGKTWEHLGLRDGQQIPRIAIDPTNPDRILVAVLGHPYGPNSERGIYRSVNGGRSFEKVLYKDENTGGADVLFAPNDPNTVYAVLWEARQGPVGERGVERPQLGALQEHRRRHDLDAARRRPPDHRRGTRPHRHRDQPERSAPHLYHGDGGREGWHLPERRRRGELGAHHGGQPLLRSRGRLRVDHGGPARREHAVHDECRLMEEHRRRLHVEEPARRAGRLTTTSGSGITRTIRGSCSSSPTRGRW
jgi:hypothetical protein